MDPLTALAAIKTGVAAGMQMHNLSKEIAGFFDATDGAKKGSRQEKEWCVCIRERRGFGNMDTSTECKDR